jgi:hypothetical protein
VEAFLHDGQEVDSTEYRGRLTELLDHLDILGLVDRV